MNVFIVFVKFLGWIVVIWMGLVRLIEEKGDLRFWKSGPTTKIKYIITKINKFWNGGEPPWGPSRSIPKYECTTTSTRIQNI